MSFKMSDFKCRSSQRYRTYNSSECCENYRCTIENCLNKFYLSIQIFINKTLDRPMSYMHHLKIAGAYFTIYFTTLPRDQGTRYNEIRNFFSTRLIKSDATYCDLMLTGLLDTASGICDCCCCSNTKSSSGLSHCHRQMT